jgi:hypothetical protein
MIATDTVITLPQSRKRPMTGAERAKAYRQRKKQEPAESRPDFDPILAPVTPEIEPAPAAITPLPVTTVTTVTAESPRFIGPYPASLFLTFAALALAGVGITMNGWFARSLGSSDIAGTLFLAIGSASDAAALALPSVAARLWRSGQRASAAMGWGVFAVTFVFAVTAGIGFASTNIADITMARAGRVTPAVETARAALQDAMTSRNHECTSGTGKFCRAREDAVAREKLDVAMFEVASVADPQVVATTRLVTWISAGVIKPTPDDFSMVRLMLLALLPQCAGLFLMVGRAK